MIFNVFNSAELQKSTIEFSHDLDLSFFSSSLYITLATNPNFFESCTIAVKKIYRKIASSNTSPLEAQVGFFRLLMKGMFSPYVL